MAQKKKLKMKPVTKRVLIVFITILVIVGVVFGYYFHCISKLGKVGYSREASNRILKEFKMDYALSNPNNKTLNAAFESNQYKEKYLDYYKQIKYQKQDNLIENINTLIEKKYSARDISIILAHGNSNDVSEFAKKEKVKYLEEFFSYAFAKLRNYDRYVKYMNEYGDDEETTVIMVNLEMDKEVYKDAVKVDDTSEKVLVNKYHAVDEKYVPKNLTKFPSQYTIAGDGSVKGAKVAVDAAVKMIEAAAKDNQKIFINSGYRSYNDQQEVYNQYLSLYGQNYVNKYVVLPGYSEHQTGYGFDFASGSKNVFKESTEYEWMMKNAHKYGFCYRFMKSKEEITGIRNEPWHYRYVGVDIATKMYEEGLSFEEYYAIYLYK